jgi:hypothetical protein
MSVLPTPKLLCSPTPQKRSDPPGHATRFMKKALVFKLCQKHFRMVLNHTVALNLGAWQHDEERLELYHHLPDF